VYSIARIRAQLQKPRTTYRPRVAPNNTPEVERFKLRLFPGQDSEPLEEEIELNAAQ
jgi:hypothetical protein